MKRKHAQSVVDFLVDILPQYQRKVKRGNHFVDARATHNLYSIWKNEKNQLSGGLLKRPSDLAEKDLTLMQEEGLVSKLGSNIKITEKGKEIIKIMILGDDRSIFDDNKRDIDFKTASTNVDTPSKMKKQVKKNEDIWWGNLLS